MATENTKESNNDWSKREMGALWRREGKSQNYLSGYVKIGEFGTEKECVHGVKISLDLVKKTYFQGTWQFSARKHGC